MVFIKLFLGYKNYIFFYYISRVATIFTENMSSSTPLKVLLLDPMPTETIKAFTDLNFTVVEDYGVKSEGQLAILVQDFNIICLSKDSEEMILTDEVLRSAHRLLAIGMFGFLKNQIDIPTAVSMGIPIFTAPFKHQNAVAELVISYIILLARQMGDRSMEIHCGEWQKVISF
jgi:D-3-phosphoglycerate dehydrogenase